MKHPTRQTCKWKKDACIRVNIVLAFHCRKEMSCDSQSGIARRTRNFRLVFCFCNTKPQRWRVFLFEVLSEDFWTYFFMQVVSSLPVETVLRRQLQFVSRVMTPLLGERFVQCGVSIQQMGLWNLFAAGQINSRTSWQAIQKKYSKLTHWNWRRSWSTKVAVSCFVSGTDWNFRIFHQKGQQQMQRS